MFRQNNQPKSIIKVEPKTKDISKVQICMSFDMIRDNEDELREDLETIIKKFNFIQNPKIKLELNPEEVDIIFEALNDFGQWFTDNESPEEYFTEKLRRINAMIQKLKERK